MARFKIEITKVDSIYFSCRLIGDEGISKRLIFKSKPPEHRASNALAHY